MKDKFILDFHLFDGEGGGEAGATASSSESAQDIKEVQYGKASPSEGNGQANSQVGSDNSAPSAEQEWASLVGKGGKFHDLYGQSVSNAIQERFKNQRDLQGQVDEIANNLSPLFTNYGIQHGDFEGLGDAIAHDDAFFQAGAEKAGLDVDQYKEMLKLKADSERLSQIDAAYQAEQERQAMRAQWESESVELQEAFPAFDLGLEYQYNERFRNLLDYGIPVRDAFYAVHGDEIRAGYSDFAHQTATQQVVNTIQQRTSRPVEGAISHTAAIQRKSDPSSLSGDDIDEINRRVANGEAISF